MNPLTSLGTLESILWAFLLILLAGPVIMFPSRPPERRYLGTIPILLMAALLLTYLLMFYLPFKAGREVLLLNGGKTMLLLAIAGLPVLTLGMGIALLRRVLTRK